MIVTIFWAVLVISLVLIVLGVAYDYPESSIIGFTFLFILGTVFLFSGLEYQSGEITSTMTNSTVTGATTILNTDSTTTFQYTIYKNHNIGFWLCVLGLTGFVASLLNVRRARES